MVAKINQDQYNILRKYLVYEKPEFFKKINWLSELQFSISDDDAIEIGNYFANKVLEVGFDENYNLTTEGIILQQLEDVFNI